MLCAVALLLSGAVFAADEAVDGTQPVAYKFTTGLYQLSGGGLPSGPGLDVNLRATAGFGNAGSAGFARRCRT